MAKRLKILDRRTHLAGGPLRPVVAIGQARHSSPPPPGNRCDCRFVRTIPVAQGQKPHRHLDRRKRVVLANGGVALAIHHRQHAFSLSLTRGAPAQFPGGAKSQASSRRTTFEPAAEQHCRPHPARRAPRQSASRSTPVRAQSSRRASPIRRSEGCAASRVAISTRSRATSRRPAVRSRAPSSETTRGLWSSWHFTFNLARSPPCRTVCRSRTTSHIYLPDGSGMDGARLPEPIVSEQCTFLQRHIHRSGYPIWSGSGG